jgi:hypothetical protein
LATLLRRRAVIELLGRVPKIDLVECASICCGYLARATITALTPAIFRIDTSQMKSWSEAAFEGSAVLRLWPILQFVLFVLGVLIVFVIVVRNRHLVGGFSALLYQNDREHWATAFRYTFIWPFC